VLTKAARKLRECQNNWEAANHEERLKDALTYNQRIWSIFQEELAKEDHPLHKKLRLDILRLGSFIDRRIFEILADPAPEKLKIVIDVNNNLAAGLRNSPDIS
jgi:flagellar biosynthesis activator protein FlaF